MSKARIRRYELVNTLTGTIVEVPTSTGFNAESGEHFYLQKQRADGRPAFMRRADYERLSDEQKKVLLVKQRESMAVEISTTKPKPAGLLEQFASASVEERAALRKLLAEDEKPAKGGGK